MRGCIIHLDYAASNIPPKRLVHIEQIIFHGFFGLHCLLYVKNSKIFHTLKYNAEILLLITVLKSCSQLFSLCCSVLYMQYLIHHGLQVGLKRFL